MPKGVSHSVLVMRMGHLAVAWEKASTRMEHAFSLSNQHEKNFFTAGYIAGIPFRMGA